MNDNIAMSKTNNMTIPKKQSALCARRRRRVSQRLRGWCEIKVNQQVQLRTKEIQSDYAEKFAREKAAVQEKCNKNWQTKIKS